MAWYSGVFDFFKAQGKLDVKGIDTTVIPSNPISVLQDTSGKPLSDLEKNTLDNFKKELSKLGKDKLSSLLKEFYFQLKTKDEMYKTLYDLRNNEIVQTVVDVMIDDGLMSSNNNRIFSIKYTGEVAVEEVQSEIDKFVTKFHLDQTVLDFIDEAIVFGEYILPIKHEKGKGVTKIEDNPNMQDMMGVYEGQEKIGFLKREDGKVTEMEGDQAIHFLLSYKKVRVEINKDFINSGFKTAKYLDKHIKVGKSIILPIINKLKQLEILEMANLALDLKRILAPVLVMVGMPENTQVPDIGKIVEEYEKILGNMFKNLGSVDELKFQDILSVAGEFKVLPSIGNTKGSISTLNLGEEKDSNQEKAENLRKSIALLLGIPFYYLSLMGENSMSRLESLKLFSRYSRKLNSMQDCIITGVRELLGIHLNSKLDYKINPDDIFIGMRQITNVELLDSIEYLVSLVSSLRELLDVMASVSELTNGAIKINPEKMLEFLNRLLSEFPECDNLLVLNGQEQSQENKVKFVSKDVNTKEQEDDELTNDNEFKLNKEKKSNIQTLKQAKNILERFGIKNDFIR